MTEPRFVCPQCGSIYYGSSENPDGSHTRICQRGRYIGGCGFQWHERDDEKYLRDGNHPHFIIWANDGFLIPRVAPIVAGFVDEPEQPQLFRWVPAGDGRGGVIWYLSDFGLSSCEVLEFRDGKQVVPNPGRVGVLPRWEAGQPFEFLMVRHAVRLTAEDIRPRRAKA